MNQEINSKLDSIIESIKILNTRLDGLEKSWQATQIQLQEIDLKLSSRCNHPETEVQAKAEKAVLKKLEETVLEIKEQLAEENNKQCMLQEQFDQLASYCKNYFRELERINVSSEGYSKCFNLLVHGVSEDANFAWENREKTEEIFRSFLSEGLHLKDPKKVNLVDLHRLPQHLLYKNGIKVNRPIIFKLQNNYDKQLVMSRLKHLKTYNENRKKSATALPAVYVSEHLFKVHYLQKQRLLSLFKQARADNKKTSWCMHDGDYCLCIDGKKARN